MDNDKESIRQLLIEVLKRLDDAQIAAIIEDLGWEEPYGKALRNIVQELDEKDRKKAMSPDELMDMLKEEINLRSGSDKKFFEQLTFFVDRAKKTDSQVYNAIGMNRSLWYRLRDNKNAKTGKENILKMAVVLHLDYWEMYYLVNLAGHSLMPKTDGTDRVVSRCIRHGIYDTLQIDELLAAIGENTLFSEK